MKKMKKMMNNEELKEFRLMLGLTCQEAGDLMYLTKQQISNIETGKSKQKSTMYLMELCYKKYLEDHKSEVYVGIDLANGDDMKGGIKCVD